MAHVAAVLGLIAVPPGVKVPVGPATEVTLERRQSTPLVAPPVELTQRAPNLGQASREVNLEALLPRPAVQAPSTPGTLRPAASAPGVPAPVPKPTPKPEAPPQITEAPPVLTAQNQPLPQGPIPALGSVPDAPPPPPAIQQEETPKLAFERPGAPSGLPRPSPGQSRVAIPRATVEEAVRAVASGGSRGGLIVGDIGEGVGGLGEALNRPPAPGRNSSSLELLSDPQGVDFRPYLIQVLSAVRRNWMAVIPESAKLGQRGRVLIQFAISRDGRVPKLVISSPSGAEALDRAAVAGISASNPFPPLPSEFRGDQIRLQFAFSYNLPAR